MKNPLCANSRFLRIARRGSFFRILKDVEFVFEGFPFIGMVDEIQRALLMPNKTAGIGTGIIVMAFDVFFR